MLETIARHDLILATAHLGRDDTFAVVDGAFAAGVKTVVVTHPEFTCQDFSIEDQVALADRGCLIERCLTTPYSGKTTYEHVFDGVRAVGVERNFFSSDCGNPDYPPVEDGLALWAGELLGAGFGDDEIRTMVRGGLLGGSTEPPSGGAGFAGAGAGTLSRRLLVIGAHSADFVWRAGGAVAVTTANGGTTQVLALSYGEHGESGELWKEQGRRSSA